MVGFAPVNKPVKVAFVIAVGDVRMKSSAELDLEFTGGIWARGASHRVGWVTGAKGECLSCCR